jgi:hypothetical protein
MDKQTQLEQSVANHAINKNEKPKTTNSAQENMSPKTQDHQQAQCWNKRKERNENAVL